MAYDFVIKQGKTFSRVLRWEAPPIIYKPITGISQSAPVSITSTAHGVPSGWRVAIVSVKGMTDINAANSPPKAKDYNKASAVDGDTIILNNVNSTDFKAYTTGGYIQYNTPVNMDGYVARMKIKDKIGGTVLLSTEVADTPLDLLTVSIDNSTKTITMTIPASATEDITWKKGVYDLEMVSGSGVVTELISGSVTVTREVTT